MNLPVVARVSNLW